MRVTKITYENNNLEQIDVEIRTPSENTKRCSITYMTSGVQLHDHIMHLTATGFHAREFLLDKGVAEEDLPKRLRKDVRYGQR